jgi:hypothetical protein
MELIGGRTPHGYLPVPESGTSVHFPESFAPAVTGSQHAHLRELAVVEHRIVRVRPCTLPIY